MPNELERFTAWKAKFSQYEESGLLDWISDISLQIAYSSLRPATQETLSAEGAKYLSDHFGVNLNSHPSLVEFLTRSFLGEVKEWSQNDLRDKVPSSTTIELALLESLFVSKELSLNIKKITESLYSLIDREALQTAFGTDLKVMLKDDESILNQISFCFGAPIYEAINLETDEVRKNNLRNNAEMLLHEMSRHETDSTQITNDLITNPANIENSLNDFFARLQTEILARGEIDVAPEALAEFCEDVRNLYLVHYQRHSVFLPFKPRFNGNLSQEEIEIILKSNEVSPLTSPLLDRAINCKDDIFKLSRALFRACAKQDILPETARLVEDSMFTKFASELLKRHYCLDGENIYFSGNPKMNESLRFLMESFSRATLQPMQELNDDLSKLRPEIKALKTKREINDEASKYMEMGLHTKISKIADTYLKPLQEEIVKTLPTAIAICNETAFSVVDGLDQAIAKARGIAQGFAERYSEIEQELSEADRRLRDSIAAAEKELKQIHEASQKAKNEARLTIPSHGVSFGNRTITELTSFENKERLADECYNKERYQVYVTDEMSKLLSESDERIRNAMLVALGSGFLHAKSSGDTGIKPMNHGEKVNGYVIAEVKLTGNAKIDNFLGVGSTGIGDVRFCGVLKDGIFLITHASLHGKNNEELFKTSEEIKKHILDGEISISPQRGLVLSSGVSLSSSSAKIKTGGKRY